MVENTRMALMLLSREVGSSIGFFEGRREETISRIWVSGGPDEVASTILKVMSEELRMPCAAWNALETCEVTVTECDGGSASRQDAYDLNVACGAAAEVSRLLNPWPFISTSLTKSRKRSASGNATRSSSRSGVSA